MIKHSLHVIAIEKNDLGDQEIWARHSCNPLLDVRLATIYFSYSFQGAADMCDYAERIAAIYKQCRPRRT